MAKLGLLGELLSYNDPKASSSLVSDTTRDVSLPLRGRDKAES